MSNVLTLFAGKMPRDSWREEAFAAATNKATGASKTRSDTVGTRRVMFYADGGNKGGRRGGPCIKDAESVLKHREILLETITVT